MRLYLEIELNEQLDSFHLSPKQKDNVRGLIAVITERYSDMIEKMKCCGNCKHYDYCPMSSNIECNNTNNNLKYKWELAE